MTETCEDEQIHVITHVETTSATIADTEMTVPIHEALATKAILPGDHLVDAGYVDAELLVASQLQQGVRLVGPVRADIHWQAREGKGYDMSCFTIDWEAKIATCPQGHSSVKWLPMRDRHGHDTIHIDFSQKDCRPCPSRSMCTKAKTEPRELTVRPQEQHIALQTARQWQKTEAFKEEYARRAGIEGTLSQAIRAFELRKSRYLG